MLVLNMEANDEYIQIGDEVRIYFKGHAGYNSNQIRIGIDAPKHIRIIRSDAINKTPKEKK